MRGDERRERGEGRQAKHLGHDARGLRPIAQAAPGDPHRGSAHLAPPEPTAARPPLAVARATRPSRRPAQPATVKPRAPGPGGRRDQPASADGGAGQVAGRIRPRAHPDHRAGPACARQRRARASALHEREPRVCGGPRRQVGGHEQRPALARQKQRAAASPRQVQAQGRRRPHGHVQRLLRRRLRSVQHHQRRRVAVGREPALEHLPAARHGRPVDPRGWRALAVGPQPVEVQLGGGAVHAPPQRRAAASVGIGAAARRAARGRRDHRLDARQHQQLLVLTGVFEGAHGQAQRVVDRQAAGLQHAPPAALEAHVDPHPARRGGAQPNGFVEERVVQLTRGRRHQPGVQLESQWIGVLLLHRVRAGQAADRRPMRGQRHPQRRPERKQPDGDARDQQRRSVEQQPRQHQRGGQSARSGRPRHAPFAPCSLTGPAPCRARRARRPRDRHPRPRAPAATGG